MPIWLCLPYLAINVREIAEFKLIRDSIEGPLEKLIGRSDHHEPVVVTMQFTYTSWSFHRRNLNSAQETKDLSLIENHLLCEYSTNKNQKKIWKKKENKVILTKRNYIDI